MSSTILLSGFKPFGGERTNPSWEVARRLDGRTIEDLAVKVLCLPVDCLRAARSITAAVERLRPAAFLGLGQAGGRSRLSLEKVALNLAHSRASREIEGGLDAGPVVRGGPDAYFSRLPLTAIARALARRGIPAGLSLSAGVYVCNAVMYASLHALRQRPAVPAGLIHLPYDTRQAVRHRNAPSMPLDLMETGVVLAISAIARGRQS
jgi:pyroglutamyl-peptidase